MSREHEPAFPQIEPARTPSGFITNGGMTLRDYFAAAALQGWIADKAMSRISEQGYDLVQAREMLAQGCYAMADAMLKERAK
jgi:hypothetical protein